MQHTAEQLACSSPEEEEVGSGKLPCYFLSACRHGVVRRHHQCQVQAFGCILIAGNRQLPSPAVQHWRGERLSIALLPPSTVTLISSMTSAMWFARAMSLIAHQFMRRDRLPGETCRKLHYCAVVLEMCKTSGSALQERRGNAHRDWTRCAKV